MARILHDDWSIKLGENRSDQSSQTFGGYAIKDKFPNICASQIIPQECTRKENNEGKKYVEKRLMNG